MYFDGLQVTAFHKLLIGTVRNFHVQRIYLGGALIGCMCM